MSLHSNDSKREEYHRYLEKSGVIEYFSHVLVDLYETPERPLDPNEFLREQLSKFFPDDTDDLRQEIAHHEEMLAERENTLNELQQQQYVIRVQLEAKGIKFDELNLLESSDDDAYDDQDVDVDGDAEYSCSAHEDGDGDADGDNNNDDDDGEGHKFSFNAEKVPVFKYHQSTKDDVADSGEVQNAEVGATKEAGDDKGDEVASQGKQ